MDRMSKKTYSNKRRKMRRIKRNKISHVLYINSILDRFDIISKPKHATMHENQTPTEVLNDSTSTHMKSRL